MQGVPRCPETERHTARHAEGTSMVFVPLFSGHTRTSQKLYAPHNGTKNAAPRLSIRVPWGRQRYAAVPGSRRLRSHWPRCTAAVAVVALCVGGPTAFVHDGLFSESGAARANLSAFLTYFCRHTPLGPRAPQPSPPHLFPCPGRGRCTPVCARSTCSLPIVACDLEAGRPESQSAGLTDISENRRSPFLT